MLWVMLSFERSGVEGMGAKSGFLTVREAAQKHRFSAGWLRTEIREGRLPAYRRGKRWLLIYEPELIVHLRSMRVTPASAEQAEYARRRVGEIMERK
jgi:excisionase family DNA binding protein